jgi:hypothetical protein
MLHVSVPKNRNQASKFVRSHNSFNILLLSCRSNEVYIFYISYIYLLVIYFFSVPKIVEIVLTGFCLLEYPVAWCILGDREFPRDR